VTRKRRTGGGGKGGGGKGRTAKAAPTAPPPPSAPAPRFDRARFARLAGLAVLSGVLWFLACADHDIWPLAWFAMVPGLFAIERAPTHRQGVVLGWLTGTTANVGGFYWLTGMLERFGHLPLPLALLGLVLLCAYQGLAFALFAHLVRRLRATSVARRGRVLAMALLAPIVMVACELVVPFIFPWYLAITQGWVAPVIQIADLTGPLGVTALLLVVNGALYDAVTERAPRRRVVPLVAAAATVAAVLTYGFVQIGRTDARRAAAPSLKVGVVQGNIAFDEKGINRRDLAARQLADLQRVSADLEQRGAELIVWSESSYPYHVGRDQAADFAAGDRRRIQRGFSRPIVLGAITSDDSGKAPYNSALLLDAGGRFTARFDKIFLLVFGEYVPLYETFGWIRKLLPRTVGHFSRGEKVVTFPFQHDGVEYRLGPMICYEDILTDFGRKLAAFHPHLLVNITNDAWFGDTAEPWEHLQLAVYRAIELRTDLVRSVNTGVSALIDANGRVFGKTYAVDPKKTPKPADGLLGEVRLVEGGHTIYAAVGDLFGWLCAAATSIGWLVWPRLRRRATATA
jgi:apolipoprotein N-acyltransferase